MLNATILLLAVVVPATALTLWTGLVMQQVLADLLLSELAPFDPEVDVPPVGLPQATGRRPAPLGTGRP